jgi:hypothetical protein
MTQTKRPYYEVAQLKHAKKKFKTELGTDAHKHQRDAILQAFAHSGIPHWGSGKLTILAN